MRQYVLSVYQPDGPTPPAEVLEGISRDPTSCKPTGGQVRCVVRLVVVNAGGELGIWTAKVAKHSRPPAVIEVTVRFGPL